MAMALGAAFSMKSWADMINGSAEFDVNLSRSRTTDATGMVTSDIRGTDIMHKYNLSLENNLFPLLKLSAGSTYLQDIYTLHDRGTSSRSQMSTLSPYLDLTLSNSLYQAAVGFTRNQNWQSGSNLAVPSMINDDYHASFGWRPVGLPDFSARFSRTDSYDLDRQNQDMTTNMATLSSQYGYRNFKFDYQFTGTDTMDNIHSTDTTSLLNNGSVGYRNQFFQQRVSLYAHYNANYLTSTTKAGNGGMVDVEKNANARLYSYNLEPWRGAEDQNTVLSAGFTAASINLGVAQLTSSNYLWSIGLDFFTPTEVNKIKVSLPSDPALKNKTIADTFHWQVWVRDSNTADWEQIDQNGNKVASTAMVSIPATYESINNVFIFTLALNNIVKYRFIKVVVNTLPQSTAVQYPQYQLSEKRFTVTNLQAFLSQPAAQVQGTSSRFSQTFNTDMRTKITESLYHNLNLSLSTTTGGEIAYVLNNNLTYDHRLNSIFTLGASAGREDLSSGGQNSSAYLYSASLKAIPLPGLNNTLVYSGRVDQGANGTSESNSLFLTNTAQPYKGVAFNLSGGYSRGTDARGRTSGSLSFASSASVVPRQDMSISMSYNRSISTTSGENTGLGTSANMTGTSQNGQLAATFRPFPNLYLFATVGIQQAEKRKAQFIQNYGGTWSPFPDGTLQFNIAYSESADSVNNQKNSSITPTISWKLAPRAMFSLSYSLLRSDSLTGSTESSSIASILRLSF
jgi:hypothetical protein